MHFLTRIEPVIMGLEILEILAELYLCINSYLPKASKTILVFRYIRCLFPYT